MTVAEINKRLWPVPECWDKMTPRQAQAVMLVLSTDYTVPQAQLLLFRILTGCGWYHFLRQCYRGRFTRKQQNGMAKIYDQLYLTDFIFTTAAITKNPVPVYKNLHGPADNFDNLRMNEYAFAQNYFEQYQADPDNIPALNGLCSVLYRPAVQGGGVYGAVAGSFSDDNREIFTESGMKARLGHIATWPFYIKELVFFWYAGCLKKLMDDNAEVFTGGDGTPALHGIVSIMRNVAKEGTYGDFEKVEMMYVKMFFMELKESKQEADQIKKQ